MVFKLIAAFEATLGAERGESEIEGVRRIAARFADLVAIGTIADVMPITDENRLIVTLGLKQIERTERVGLAALLDEASAGAGGKPQKRRKIKCGTGLATPKGSRCESSSASGILTS